MLLPNTKEAFPKCIIKHHHRASAAAVAAAAAEARET